MHIHTQPRLPIATQIKIWTYFLNKDGTGPSTIPSPVQIGRLLLSQPHGVYSTTIQHLEKSCHNNSYSSWMYRNKKTPETASPATPQRGDDHRRDFITSATNRRYHFRMLYPSEQKYTSLYMCLQVVSRSIRSKDGQKYDANMKLKNFHEGKGDFGKLSLKPLWTSLCLYEPELRRHTLYYTVCPSA